MRTTVFLLLSLIFISSCGQCADKPSFPWEKQDTSYYLSKDSRDTFSAAGAGANIFAGKYLKVNGVDFLVRGENERKDYGRLDLDANKAFRVPIKPGMKIETLHLLGGGNFGNSYEHDPQLRLYGDNYYYATITVTFIYQNGIIEQRSVPVFWDWFRLNAASWSKDGATIRYAGANPVRKDCSMAEMTFINPHPDQPLNSLLISDSWLSDRPFSDIFGLTIVSADTMEASPRQDKQFKASVRNAASEPTDTNNSWGFNEGIDGWISGCSENWTAETAWNPEKFGRKGVIAIPACNWGGDKYAWIEKKIALPKAGSLSLEFWRHSALLSENAGQWSDGRLKVTVKPVSGNQETVYEKIFSGEWNRESADISRFRGQAVIIRFENHGAGAVRMNDTSSPSCDAEDALIDHIQVTTE